MNATIKRAALGGEHEAQFEESFSKLAYTYIKDKAPRLLDYTVGFQLLDQNEDNTKAVGVFGFSPGGSMVYVPIFFLNGKFKGHELMFVKDYGVFLPLKDKWVDYLLANQESVLGRGVNFNAASSQFGRPDVARMLMPPTMSGKSGSVSVPGWLVPFIRFTKMAHAKDARAVYRQATGFLSLEKLAADPFGAAFVGVDTASLFTPRMLAKAARVFEDMPVLKRLFEERHGPIQTSILKFGSAPQAAVPKAPASILGDPAPHPSSLVSFPDAKSASDEEKEELLVGRFPVRDGREDRQKSMAVSSQDELRLTSPSENGVYDVLDANGGFVKAIVLVKLLQEDAGLAMVIQEDGRNKAAIVPVNSIFCRPDDGESARKNVADLGSDSLPEPGRVFIAIGPGGVASSAMMVKAEEASGVAVTSEYIDTQRDEKDFMRRCSIPNDYYGTDSLRVTDWEGGTLSKVRSTLTCPKGTKFLKLWQKKKENEVDNWWVDPSRDSRAFRLGDGSNVRRMLFSKTAFMRLAWDGGDVLIDSARLGVKDAFVHLVRDHGLDAAAAEEMLKRAQVSRVATFHVKHADRYPLPPGAPPLGPGAPHSPPRQTGNENVAGKSYPAVYGDESHTRGEPSTVDTQAVYDPFKNLDHKAMGEAQQHGEKGHGEAMDASLFSGLLRDGDQDTQIENGMPVLMKAMDQLGSLLFMYYWHKDDWDERYGKQDLPEVESAMRNTFESLGDTVLYLRERSVRSPLDSFAQSDLGEAGRN